MNPAPNLVLVGPTGAGKSSIGRRLGELLALEFTDADRQIEVQAGTSVALLFESEGEAGFRARERAVLTQLLAGEGRVIATGGGAVLDAANRRDMQVRGFVVHLHAGVAEQLQRLARDRTRPLLQGENREDVLRQMAQAREPLYAQVADLHFDTQGMTPAEASTALVQLLATRWQRLLAPQERIG